MMSEGPAWNCWETWQKNHVLADMPLVYPPVKIDVVSFTLAMASQYAKARS